MFYVNRDEELFAFQIFRRQLALHGENNNEPPKLLSTHHAAL